MKKWHVLLREIYENQDSAIAAIEKSLTEVMYVPSWPEPSKALKVDWNSK